MGLGVSRGLNVSWDGLDFLVFYVDVNMVLYVKAEVRLYNKPLGDEPE